MKLDGLLLDSLKTTVFLFAICNIKYIYIYIYACNISGSVLTSVNISWYRLKIKLLILRKVSVTRKLKIRKSTSQRYTVDVEWMFPKLYSFSLNSFKAWLFLTEKGRLLRVMVSFKCTGLSRGEMFSWW